MALQRFEDTMVKKQKPPSLAVSKNTPNFDAFSPTDLEALSIVFNLVLGIAPDEILEKHVDNPALVYTHLFVLLRQELRMSA
jgi:hypothetical protein